MFPSPIFVIFCVNQTGDISFGDGLRDKRRSMKLTIFKGSRCLCTISHKQDDRSPIMIIVSKTQQISEVKCTHDYQITEGGNLAKYYDRNAIINNKSMLILGQVGR
jgi:hypothetical protein